MDDANKSILLTTAYLPPVSWMQAALPAKSILIEAFESYSRQTYRNRCRLLTANGLISLSIPVKKTSGQKTMTKDVEIYYGEPWQRLHWRTIDTAYSNSPFYLYYMDDIRPFFEKKFRFLIDFNLEVLNTIFMLMNVDKEVSFTDEYLKTSSGITDLRDALSPKRSSSGTDFKPYQQVFAERFGFIPDLSIIDLLFNEGPSSLMVLNNK